MMGYKFIFLLLLLLFLLLSLILNPTSSPLSGTNLKKTTFKHYKILRATYTLDVQETLRTTSQANEPLILNRKLF
jgi:hypothetical protein